MEEKKKYNQGPQYDKAPTLKPIKTDKKNFFVKVVKNNKHYIFLFFLLVVLFSTKWGTGLIYDEPSGYLIYECSEAVALKWKEPYFLGYCIWWNNYKPLSSFIFSFFIISILFFFREFYFKKSN